MYTVNSDVHVQLNPGLTLLCHSWIMQSSLTQRNESELRCPLSHIISLDTHTLTLRFKYICILLWPLWNVNPLWDFCSYTCSMSIYTSELTHVSKSQAQMLVIKTLRQIYNKRGISLNFVRIVQFNCYPQKGKRNSISTAQFLVSSLSIKSFFPAPAKIKSLLVFFHIFLYF